MNLSSQMNDSDIDKLTSLANIQQTFPNDDLNLFETPAKYASQNKTHTTSTTPTNLSSKLFSTIKRDGFINTTPFGRPNKKHSFSFLKVCFHKILFCICLRI